MSKGSAVLVDLDDTLYDQREFLVGAWDEVVRTATTLGIEPAAFRAALDLETALGSDRGSLVDGALARVGRPQRHVAPLVGAFRAYRPARLTPYPGVCSALAQLSARHALGVVTDGDPDQQRAKLAALRLPVCFDVIVCSDELGREHRKPDPAPFQRALAQLECAPGDAVMIGDRPDKDVVGALAAGLRAVRVRTGEHARQPDGTDMAFDTFAEAAAYLSAPSSRSAFGMQVASE